MLCNAFCRSLRLVTPNTRPFRLGSVVLLLLSAMQVRRGSFGFRPIATTKTGTASTGTEESIAWAAARAPDGLSGRARAPRSPAGPSPVGPPEHGLPKHL